MIRAYPDPAVGHLDYQVTSLACYLAGDPRYGVASKALGLAGASVAPSWISDVAKLGVGRVRVDVRYTVAPEAANCDASDPTIVGALSPISAALSAYRKAGVEPLAVLTGGIPKIDIDTDFRPGGIGQCATTGETYIEAFPKRAAKIAKKLYDDAGVTCFEIWNEPNVPTNPDGVTENPEFIADSGVFAQLVFDTVTEIATEFSPIPITSLTIVTGGIFISDINPTDDADYVTSTMRALRDKGPACWNQIGVHNYRSTPANGNSTQTALDSQFATDSIDPRTMWITEFGEQRGCTDANCLIVNPSGPAQASDLNDWYTEMINPGLTSVGGTIDAAFWFSHEKEEASVGPPEWGNWGLTNWDADGQLRPTQHWPSWELLRESMARGAP